MTLAAKQETGWDSKDAVSKDTVQLSVGDIETDFNTSQSVMSRGKCDDDIESKPCFDSQLSNTSLSSASNSIHSPSLSSTSATNSIHSPSPSSTSATNTIHSPSHSSLLCCMPSSRSQPSISSNSRRSRRGRHRKRSVSTDRHVYPKHITRSASKWLKEFEGKTLPTPEGASLEPSPLAASPAIEECHSREDQISERQEKLAPDGTHTGSTEYPIADCVAGCHARESISHGSHGYLSTSMTPAQIGQSTSTELLLPPPPPSCNGGELNCDGLGKETTTQVHTQGL